MLLDPRQADPEFGRAPTDPGARTAPKPRRDPGYHAPVETSELGGAGSSGDALHLRHFLRIARRCLPLLRPMRTHLIGFAGGVALGGTVAIAVGALFFDLHWTRVLEGQPLTHLEAHLLRLDPATFADITGPLDPSARRIVRDRTLIGAIGFVLIAGSLGGALFYYLVWILQQINQRLRLQLLDRLQTLSLRFHDESRIGDAIYRLYQDSAMVTSVIQTLILEPTGQILRFLTAIAVVAAFDPALAVVLCAIWPPALLVGRWFSPRLRTGFRRAREANSELTSRIQETLAGIQVIKAYGAEAVEQSRFEQHSTAAFASAFRARNLYAVLGVILFGLVGASLLATTAAAAVQTQLEAGLFAQRLLIGLGFASWTLGRFNLFKAVSGAGTQGIEQLFKLWARAQDVSVGLDRVFQLLDLEPEVRDEPGARPMQPVRSGVAFRGVAFRYQPERPVLENIEFEAHLGTITAITGPTGAGKSTLMSLLLRLFDPDAGRIEIDGLDLRKLQLASLRAHVSIALQENLLFGTSVRENIRFAVPHATESEIREAARVACADRFIEALPDGYDTLLGERGSRLSTGQRQRLSVARAVLKNSSILILDEPTASLDAETEIAVLANLAEWGRRRVVFLITHRLSTIRHADQILVVNDGRIVERGNHASLVQSNGSYRKWLRSSVSAPPTSSLEP